VAFSLKLPKKLARHWAVKIRDRERVEPPHVTILRKLEAWRLNLRTAEFMDDEPDPADIPEAILAIVKEGMDLLRTRWDEMYPENPIVSGEDFDD
jgi:hypothetical protein